MKQLPFFVLLLTLGISFASIPTQALWKNVQADRIFIEKSKRTLHLYHGKKLLKSYRVSLGGQPVGPKTQQGDHKTPEGKYLIDDKNPNSNYHLALHISYPNAKDRKRAKALGVSPGGLIMIHGLPNKWKTAESVLQYTDWTDGCIAVNNSDIEEIYRVVAVGTQVEIVP